MLDAVAKLNALKQEQADISARLEPPTTLEMDREAFSNLLTRRFFLAPSFEIYGGFGGLYDLGPPGCAVKKNLLDLWRRHFVLEENMLELDTVSVTPATVLRASGHEERFADLMVSDAKTGNCYRADHLLEDAMDKLIESKKTSDEDRSRYRIIRSNADGSTPEELGALLTEFKVKAPDTGNDISAPFRFNLMFATQIGPTAALPGYMRPETAQGMFVNFGRLLEFNSNKLPFAAATIGQAFRNEIAPRQGLLRVREFTLAEIEHFVFPDEKDHPRFSEARDVEVQLFPRAQQNSSRQRMVRTTFGKAIDEGVIDNTTIAYFMYRTFLFLQSIGIHFEKLRFRQHLEKEMAHYAQECWDAEILTTYGWIECVGIADRSCYDLSCHAKATGSKLRAFRKFPDGPREVETSALVLNKKVLGQNFKKDAKKVTAHLEGLPEEQQKALQDSLSAGPVEVEIGGAKFSITAEMVSFKTQKKKVSGEDLVPSVIEPSFGIGRILYAMLEHSFVVRPEDAKKTYVALKPTIAPVKCSVLPLEHKEIFSPFVAEVSTELRQRGVSFKVDDVGQTVGKRYARTDEIGIPFGITVDRTTLEDRTVTLRERDSTKQCRVPMAELGDLVVDLVEEKVQWATVMEQRGEFIA